jgi:hypothetical protein
VHAAHRQASKKLITKDPFVRSPRRVLPKVSTYLLSILRCVFILSISYYVVLSIPRPRYHPDTTSRPFAAKLLVRPRLHWPPASLGHAVTGRLPHASTCIYFLLGQILRGHSVGTRLPAQ